MNDAPGVPQEIPSEPPVLAPQTAPAVSPPTAPPPGEPFLFHGEAREYFRIWIVNTAMTIGTLGVYAAWAKVRRRRYLRGNIELMGHRFEYTARPVRLLIGNILVLAFFLAYALFGSVYPMIRLAAFGLGLVFLPWVVVRSLAFNAHNTAYRGIRFRFHPSLSAAAMTYLFQFVPVILTLGIYYPQWSRDARRFSVERHRYGSGYFRFEVSSSPFYSAYLTAGGVVLASLVCMGVALFVLRRWFDLQTLTLAATFGIYLPVVFLARQFVHARIFNAAWNGTRLDECRFSAAMSTRRWIGLQTVNWAAIIGTAGILYPWAAMRAARYTASCLRFHPNEDFYRLCAIGESGGSAISDTAAEFVGLDFGL